MTNLFIEKFKKKPDYIFQNLITEFRRMSITKDVLSGIKFKSVNGFNGHVRYIRILARNNSNLLEDSIFIIGGPLFDKSYLKFSILEAKKIQSLVIIDHMI